MKFDKEGIGPALVSFAIMFVIALVMFRLVVADKILVGPAVLLFGFLPWPVLKLAGRTIKSVGADIIFGIVDGGILGAAAMAGATFAGAIGAVFGGSAGNALSDGFGGLWEGTVSEWLRKHKIEEARTPLSSSMGKMSGVALGAGIVLVIAWTILRL